MDRVHEIRDRLALFKTIKSPQRVLHLHNILWLGLLCYSKALDLVCLVKFSLLLAAKSIRSRQIRQSTWSFRARLIDAMTFDCASAAMQRYSAASSLKQPCCCCKNYQFLNTMPVFWV